MDPKTEFFSNYCNGIPGLANYEMPSEVCEDNFRGPFLSLRHLGLGTWRPAILESRLLAAEVGKSRQVGWQQAILESRLLAAELGKSRQV